MYTISEKEQIIKYLEYEWMNMKQVCGIDWAFNEQGMSFTIDLAVEFMQQRKRHVDLSDPTLQAWPVEINTGEWNKPKTELRYLPKGKKERWRSYSETQLSELKSSNETTNEKFDDDDENSTDDNDSESDVVDEIVLLYSPFTPFWCPIFCSMKTKIAVQIVSKSRQEIFTTSPPNFKAIEIGYLL